MNKIFFCDYCGEIACGDDLYLLFGLEEGGGKFRILHKKCNAFFPAMSSLNLSAYFEQGEGATALRLIKVFEDYQSEIALNIRDLRELFCRIFTKNYEHARRHFEEARRDGLLSHVETPMDLQSCDFEKILNNYGGEYEK